MARNDFNRDGYSDILWQNSAWTQLGWSNMANGKMGAYNVVYNQYSIIGAHGDYNGDGYADMLVGMPNGAALSYTVRDSRTGSVTSVFSEIDMRHRVGNFERTDFTGDGADDILVFNPATGTLGFYDMYAGYNTGYRPLYSQNFNEWWIAGADDFTGDGTDDILWVSRTTGESGYWEMYNGNVLRYVSLGYRGAPVETGDFTGDRSADILYQTGSLMGWSAGTMTAVDMDRGVATRNIFSYTPGSGWGVQDVGDYTNDGAEDIVMWNRDTNEVRYLDMAQNGTFSHVNMGYVDEYAWSIV